MSDDASMSDLAVETLARMCLLSKRRTRLTELICSRVSLAYGLKPVQLFVADLAIRILAVVPYAPPGMIDLLEMSGDRSLIFSCS